MGSYKLEINWTYGIVLGIEKDYYFLNIYLICIRIKIGVDKDAKGILLFNKWSWE